MANCYANCMDSYPLVRFWQYLQGKKCTDMRSYITECNAGSTIVVCRSKDLKRVPEHRYRVRLKLRNFNLIRWWKRLNIQKWKGNKLLFDFRIVNFLKFKFRIKFQNFEDNFLSNVFTFLDSVFKSTFCVIWSLKVISDVYIYIY